MAIRHMRIACWIPKATKTHPKYVILIAFPPQKWWHERAWMLRYTYISCPDITRDAPCLLCRTNLNMKYNSDLSYSLEGRAIARALSRQPVAAQARVRSQASPFEICGGQSGTTKDFSPNTSVSSVSSIPSVPQAHLYTECPRRKGQYFGRS
jgi:hypothetical protein